MNSEAYQLGFEDGYNEGEYDNPYTKDEYVNDPNYDLERQQYKEGYDAGVAGYCYEELDDHQPDELTEWHDFDPDC
jgi:hypothetical protein